MRYVSNTEALLGQILRHSIDNKTASVRSDNQILDQIVWRDYLKNVIEAESRVTLPKFILYLQTTCFVFSVEDAERGTDLPLLAHSYKSAIIRIIMRHEYSALVAKGTAIAQVTQLTKVLQVKSLHSSVL